MSAVSDLMPVIARQYDGDSRIDTVTEMVAQRVTASAFGNLYTQAMTYLVAHVLTMLDRGYAESGGTGTSSTGGASVGTVSSKSAGDLSIAYAGVANAATLVTSLGDAELAQTPYGLAYLGIRNSRVAARGRVVSL